ncbi:MAG: cytochrome c oxidase subunit II [Actinomycetota bacterium]|nr:cytochrome c oxidase subunit II [Actinomycetota bacterium]
MRRGAVVWLTAVALAAAAVALAIAFFIPWLPDTASEESERIAFVFWFTTIICIAIFGVVAGLTLYSVVKFRAREDDDSDGPPIHGHTGLEIAWTAVPAVLVTAIAIVSAIALARNDRAGPDALRVDVLGQQFAWTFTYPDQNGLTSGHLRLPVGRTVKLHFQARDVIHSFWVPQFGQKQDTVPGLETTLVITPNKVGTFPVVCTELCGLGHAVMRTQAIVMPQAAFDRWVRERGRGGDGARDPGLAVFESAGCGACHTLAAARSTGETGPELDDLAARADEVGMPLEDFVRESIVEPGARKAPGFEQAEMPDTFDELPDQQLDALVEFLVDSGRGNGA